MDTIQKQCPDIRITMVLKARCDFIIRSRCVPSDLPNWNDCLGYQI